MTLPIRLLAPYCSVGILGGVNGHGAKIRKKLTCEKFFREKNFECGFLLALKKFKKNFECEILRITHSRPLMRFQSGAVLTFKHINTMEYKITRVGFSDKRQAHYLCISFGVKELSTDINGIKVVNQKETVAFCWNKEPYDKKLENQTVTEQQLKELGLL